MICDIWPSECYLIACRNIHWSVYLLEQLAHISVNFSATSDGRTVLYFLNILAVATLPEISLVRLGNYHLAQHAKSLVESGVYKVGACICITLWKYIVFVDSTEVTNLSPLANLIPPLPSERKVSMATTFTITYTSEAVETRTHLSGPSHASSYLQRYLPVFYILT